MELIKKSMKPSLGKKKTAQMTYAHEEHFWDIEQDSVTDLWNIYVHINEDKREFVGSREDLNQAQVFVAINGEYILEDLI